MFYISDIAKDRTLERIHVHVGRKTLPTRVYSLVNSTLEIDLLNAWKDMGISEGHDESEEVVTVSVELS